MSTDPATRRSILHATADEYAEGATVHGVSYIFNELLPAIDRVIWGASVTAFFILAVFFTTNAYTDWQENLVITTLKNTAKDVTLLPFPAVTICTEGLTMDTVSRALARDFSQWAAEAGPAGDGQAGQKSATVYMQEKFGIKPEDDFSIFEVVNAMSSSNVEKSTGANGVRTNQLACTEAGKNFLVSNETLCDDFGGVIVEKTDTNGTVSSLCFLVGTKNSSTYNFTTACQRTNGLNTSLHIFPWNFLAGYRFNFSNLPPMNAWIEHKVAPSGKGSGSGVGNESDSGLETSTECYSREADSADFGDSVNNTIDCVELCNLHVDSSGASFSPDQQTCVATSAPSSGRKKKRAAEAAEASSRKKRQADSESILPLIDIFLNPERYPEKEQMEQIMRNLTLAFFSSSDMSVIYPNLFRLLWYSSLPCSPLPGVSDHHLLSRCEWRGEVVDCADIFETAPTDSGMCCSFNAEKTLRKSQYSDLIDEMRERDRDIRNLPPLQDHGTRMVRIGKRNGLRLILDQHSNAMSMGTVAQDHSGFQVFVGDRAEFPVMRERSLLVRPGHETFLEVSGYVVTSAEGTRSLEPEDRGCLFVEEGGLTHYSKYSYASCKFECLTEVVAATVGCVPWYIPHGGSTRVCQPWEGLQFIKVLGGVGVGDCKRSCLPDCETIIYSFAQSSAPFRRCDSRNLNLSPLCDLTSGVQPQAWATTVKAAYGDRVPSYVSSAESPLRSHYPGERAERQEIIETLTDPKVSDTQYNAFEKDIAVLNIFFGKPTTIEYERIKRMTAIDFISSVGGLFGLCLGFSLISFFEIIYWFIIRLFRNIMGSKKEPLRVTEKEKAMFTRTASGSQKTSSPPPPAEYIQPPQYVEPAQYVEEEGRHWISSMAS